MSLLLAAVASGTAPASSLLCHVGEVEVEEGPFLMEGKGVDLDAELNVQCTWSTFDEDAERDVQCTTSVLEEAELDAQCALSVWLVMNETRSARRQFWSCRTRRAVHVVGVVDERRAEQKAQCALSVL